jgi:peptidyl-prolyl cis-trans isomerase D
VALPDTYIDTLVAYAGERRSFSWAEVADLTTGLPVASEDDLKAFYEENINVYTRPQTKQITFAWLTPEMILDTVEVDQDTLRAAYEEREAEFNLPERRLVERLVFADDASAQAAADRVAAGDASFEDLVRVRDLLLSDTDLGDVTREDLAGAADQVFAAETGAVVGPAPSDLGAALFRVNAVLDAQSTSFEDAIPALRGSLALDRARRVIEAQAQDYDDELAGGATLEELAELTDLQLGQIGWTGQNDDDIAGFERFRQLAENVSANDYPAIEQLGDGGIVALRLDEILEPAPIPFEDVREDVASAWETDQRAKALLAQAESLIDTVKTGDFAAASLQANTEETLTRTSFGAELPADMLLRAFELAQGDVVALPGQDRAYLLRLNAVKAADPEDESLAQLRQVFSQQANNDVANDLFRALSSDIQTRAGVTLDQAAINAVHTNFH